MRTHTNTYICDYIGRHYIQMKITQDSQRKAVYRWERETYSKLPEMRKRFTHVGEMQVFVDALCVFYGLRPAEVGIAKTLKYSTAIGISSIRMAPNMWTTGVLLHELAHILTFNLRIPEPAHGPTFVGVLIFLGETVVGIPRSVGLQHVRKYNLHVQDIDVVNAWLYRPEKARESHMMTAVRILQSAVVMAPVL